MMHFRSSFFWIGLVSSFVISFSLAWTRSSSCSSGCWLPPSTRNAIIISKHQRIRSKATPNDDDTMTEQQQQQQQQQQQEISLNGFKVVTKTQKQLIFDDTLGLFF